MHTEAFTQRSLYTEWLLHAQVFTQREVFTQRSFYTQKVLSTPCGICRTSSHAFSRSRSYLRAVPCANNIQQQDLLQLVCECIRSFTISLWTGMWMSLSAFCWISQLFLKLQKPQSTGFCQYHSTWTVVRSAEAQEGIY